MAIKSFMTCNPKTTETLDSIDYYMKLTLEKKKPKQLMPKKCLLICK